MIDMSPCNRVIISLYALIFDPYAHVLSLGTHWHENLTNTNQAGKKLLKS